MESPGTEGIEKSSGGACCSSAISAQNRMSRGRGRGRRGGMRREGRGRERGEERGGEQEVKSYLIHQQKRKGCCTCHSCHHQDGFGTRTL